MNFRQALISVGLSKNLKPQSEKMKARRRDSKLYNPALLETALKLTFVPSFVAVIMAFGTTAPVASRTVPTMRPVAV
jgi:hypothetical protein